MGVIIFLISLMILFTGIFIYKRLNKIDYTLTEYEENLINYFNEIALKSEFDDNPQKTIKWKKPMIIFIFKDDQYNHQIKIINRVIDGINNIATDGFEIRLTDKVSECNAVLYLLQKNKVKTLDPLFMDGINEDFAGLAETEFEWTDYSIVKSKIFIDIDESIELQEVSILEEITQSIGLMNDSELYSNSVFYEKKTDENIFTTEYSKMDIDIIRLLYHPKMKSGYDGKKVEKVIKRILKKEAENRN